MYLMERSSASNSTIYSIVRGGGVARFALLIGLLGQLLHPFDLPKESNKQRQLF